MPLPLSVRHLTKRYGAQVAVADVGFDVQQGEIYGLLGRNGAGKTTTLECIAGLREPDTGEVHISGVDVRRQRRPALQQVGVQLQHTALPDQATVQECLRLFGAFAERPVLTETLLRTFGLTELAGARFHALSGGQRQRLALALAFVNQPRLLILDEPSAGLDRAARRVLHDQVRTLAAEGRAVLLTTHDLEEAEALCDRVGVLEAGRLQLEGRPSQLAGGASRVQVVAFMTDPALTAEALGQLPGVRQPAAEGPTVAFASEDAAVFIEVLGRLLQSTGTRLVGLDVRRPSLAERLGQRTAATEGGSDPAASAEGGP